MADNEFVKKAETNDLRSKKDDDRSLMSHDKKKDGELRSSQKKDDKGTLND